MPSEEPRERVKIEPMRGRCKELSPPGNPGVSRAPVPDEIFLDPSRPVPRTLHCRRTKNLLIVGWNRRSRRHLEEIAVARNAQIHVVAVLDTEDRTRLVLGDEPRAAASPLTAPSFAPLDRLAEILKAHPVDEVLITLPVKSHYDRIQEVIRICEEAGTPFSLSTDLFESSIARPGSSSWGRTVSRITYSCVHYPIWKLAIKRFMDISISLTALVVLALPMLLVALLIKLSSRGPVFFVQERVGKNHKLFKMLKFRTMVQDAEKLREEMHHLNEQAGPVFKIRRDPRVTRIGRFLRRFSIDELPQIINVLKGEMSLVGPRPPILSEVQEYEWWQRRRLSMRPGLTCFWQVSGRNQIDFEEWMNLDLKYIDNWSLLLDVRLVLKTFAAVFRGSGH